MGEGAERLPRRPGGGATPERIVGAGVWVDKLLVIRRGFNKYYYKYYSRLGGPGAEEDKLSPWVLGVCPGGSPGGIWGRGLSGPL